MDIAELDKESAELLPERQALGCWNYGSWYGYGYYSSLNLGLNLNLHLTSFSFGW